MVVVTTTMMMERRRKTKTAAVQKRRVSPKYRMTSRAHDRWSRVRLENGDTLVDFTCGNGHDSLELLTLMTNGGKDSANRKAELICVDVQHDAIEATKSRLRHSSLLADEENCVHYHCGCHLEYVKENAADLCDQVKLAVLNLGYLPGAQGHDVMTRRETTRALLTSLVDVRRRRTNTNTNGDDDEEESCIIKRGGLISVVCYRGHDGGEEEYQAVLEVARHLDDDWSCVEEKSINASEKTPVLVLITRCE